MMKKLLLTLFVFYMYYSAFAQYDNTKTDVVRLMERHLINEGALNIGDLDDGVKIRVGNMLAKRVELNTSKLNSFIQSEDFGIFFFEVFSPHRLSYLLLKSGDNYEILQLYDNTSENDGNVNFITILNKVVDYFKRHPEIDSRLYSYYVREISDCYIVNTFQGYSEAWNNWHNGHEFTNPSIPEKYKYGIDVK